MLFGDYFDGSIFVLPEHNPLRELGEEFHGPLEFVLDAFTGADASISRRPARSSRGSFTSSAPICPARWQQQFSGLYRVLDEQVLLRLVQRERAREGRAAARRRSSGGSATKRSSTAALVNGSAQTVGLRRGGRARFAVGLPLSLCVRDDLRTRGARRLAGVQGVTWQRIAMNSWPLAEHSGLAADRRRRSPCCCSAPARARSSASRSRSARPILTFVVSIPLYTRFRRRRPPRCSSSRTCRGSGASRRSMRSASTASRCRCPAHDVPDADRRDRGLAGDQAATRAVLRVVPDARRADDRRVRGNRRAALLRLLGSDARADVHHHRRLGRRAAHLRDRQVLPLHVPGLRVHARRADLHVPEGRRSTRSRRSRACRSR